MTLIAILLATLAAGIGSVWLAAGLMRLHLLAPGSSGAVSGEAAALGPQHLLSLAAGALLAVPWATLTVRHLPEPWLRAGVGALTLVLGLVSLISR